MLSDSKVYQQFYSGTSWTGPVTAHWINSNVDISSDRWGYTTINYISAEIITAIQFSTTGALNINYSSDDGWNIYLDDTQYSSTLGLSSDSGNFNFNAEANKYYIEII